MRTGGRRLEPLMVTRGFRPAILPLLGLLLAGTGCSLLPSAPADPTDLPAVPSPTPLPEDIESLLPHTIAGVPLEIQVLTGEALSADGGEAWQSYLVEVGLAAEDLRLAVAAPAPQAGLAFEMSAWRVRGADWPEALTAFTAYLSSADEGAVQFDVIELAGRSVLQGLLTTGQPPPAIYYLPVGDVLFSVQTPDLQLAEEAMSQLPGSDDSAVSVSVPTGDTPAYESGEGVFSIFLVTHEPYCVGYDESLGVFVAVDPPNPSGGRYPPVPAAAYTLDVGAALGEVVPIVSMTATGTEILRGFTYNASRIGQDTIRASVRFEGARLSGTNTWPLEVIHCLNGEWQDPQGPRTLRIDHFWPSTIQADILSGELCGESGGPAFDGALSQTSQVDLSLQACNPDACVDAGLLEAKTTTEFQGTVSDDGRRIEGQWTRVNYGGQWNDDGELIACFPTDQELVPLTFTRDTFGPDKPYETD